MNRVRFLLINYAINIAFKLSRLAALPSWVIFFLARPTPHQLSYDDLLAMRAQHPIKTEQFALSRQRHQNKWAGRVAEIAHIYGCQKLLEIGCGQGLAARNLQQAGFDVSANDVTDVLDQSARQAGVRFLEGDICNGLNYPDADYDLIFSVNAFEHFHNPAAALDEMLRILKPGGLLYLTFDPLYYSPWGLHAVRRLGFPYPQILFSEAAIQRFVNEKAAEIAESYDPNSDKTKIGPPLNYWTVEQFRQIFKKQRRELKMIFYTERATLHGLGMIARHPGIFKAEAPSFTSLIVSGINLLAKKT